MHQQAAYVPPPPIPVTSFQQTSQVQQQPQQPKQPQQPQQPQPTPTPPLKTPYGIEPQDVPWLADLIARQAVRLFDSRLLQDLTPGVAIGHHYALHTAQAQIQVYSPGAPPVTTTCLAALKQYHRPADMIMEVKDKIRVTVMCLLASNPSLCNGHTFKNDVQCPFEILRFSYTKQRGHG